MKVAADFRSIARNVLAGKWAIAVVVGLIAALLGGLGANGPEVKLNIEMPASNASLEYAGQTIFPQNGVVNSELGVCIALAAARLLQSLYVLLWSLLFIIPGIVATYSYAMTSYILADHPELTASEAIERSKEMMVGNRFSLFCLQFSFIGWTILCAITLGIGNLWLTPYKQAATAAFYREISVG